MKQAQTKFTDLERELTRTKKELSALYQLSKSAVSGYLEHLLSCIVNLTNELIRCDICSIMILDTDQNALVVRATQSLDDEYLKKSPVKVDDSLSGLAILERRSLQWPDITQEPRFKYQPLAKRLGLKSLLSIPMLVKTRPLGVINFYTIKERLFSEEEIQLLNAITNQAAITLERNYLEQEAQIAKRALAERKLIERAKGILMDKKDLHENQAYSLMRKKSMNSHKSMLDLAKIIILAEDI